MAKLVNAWLMYEWKKKQQPNQLLECSRSRLALTWHEMLNANQPKPNRGVDKILRKIVNKINWSDFSVQSQLVVIIVCEWWVSVSIHHWIGEYGVWLCYNIMPICWLLLQIDIIFTRIFFRFCSCEAWTRCGASKMEIDCCIAGGPKIPEQCCIGNE